MNAPPNVNAAGGGYESGIEMNNMAISNCRFKQANGANGAINLVAADVFVIKECAIESNSAGGIRIGGDVRALKVEQNYFEGNVGPGDIIYDAGAQALGHLVQNNYFNAVDGIYFKGAAIIDGLLVQANYFDGDGDSIIWDSGIKPIMRNFVIRNNHHANVVKIYDIDNTNWTSNNQLFPATTMYINDTFNVGSGIRPYLVENPLRFNANWVVKSGAGTITESNMTHHGIKMIDCKSTSTTVFQFTLSPLELEEVRGKLITINLPFMPRTNDSNIQTPGPNITQAAPPRVTASGAHGMSSGDNVYIQGVLGMTEINNRWYTIDNISSTQFDIYEVGPGIRGITNANPAVVTMLEDHGLDNGDVVFLSGVTGMTQVDNLTFTVANKTGDTFELSGIDSTLYGTYSGGGTAAKRVDGTGWGAHTSGGTWSKAEGSSLTMNVIHGGAAGQFTLSSLLANPADNVMYWIVDRYTDTFSLETGPIGSSTTLTMLPPSIRLGAHNTLKYDQADPTSMTAKDAGTANSGDATTDGIIDNNRTRIEEIETQLKRLQILK
jgi:hypothetical protein